MAYARSRPSPELSTPSPAQAEQPPAAEVQACGEVEPAFDTPGHVLVGDSVHGQAVTIHEVTFSAGELNALVDYVGSLDVLATDEFDHCDLLKMQQLLRDGCEDAKLWDEVTHGRYSKLSFDNENHFAPGSGGGPDFRSSFVSAFARAFALAQQANAGEGNPEDQMTLARLALYESEHYLEDAFSAGHQVSADDVDARVDALLGTAGEAYLLTVWFPTIAADVLSREPEALGRYALQPGILGPIDSASEVQSLLAAMLASQRREGLRDAVRFAVHEELEVGVQVTSPSHPEPWTLTGDHDVQENEETLAALRAALTDTRNQIEVGAVPGLDPDQVANQVFDRHCPVPTAEGQAVVEDTVEQATSSWMGLSKALADAMCGQIEAILEGATDRELLVRLAPGEAPEPPPSCPEDPPPSYIRRDYWDGFGPAQG